AEATGRAGTSHTTGLTPSSTATGSWRAAHHPGPHAARAHSHAAHPGHATGGHPRAAHASHPGHATGSRHAGHAGHHSLRASTWTMSRSMHLIAKIAHLLEQHVELSFHIPQADVRVPGATSSTAGGTARAGTKSRSSRGIGAAAGIVRASFPGYFHRTSLLGHASLILLKSGTRVTKPALHALHFLSQTADTLLSLAQLVFLGALFVLAGWSSAGRLCLFFAIALLRPDGQERE